MCNEEERNTRSFTEISVESVSSIKYMSKMDYELSEEFEAKVEMRKNVFFNLFVSQLWQMLLYWQ